MSGVDIETLRIECEAALAEREHAWNQFQRAERAATQAGNELINAIVAAGLTEYGPISSRMSETNEPYEGTPRRIWFERRSG